MDDIDRFRGKHGFLSNFHRRRFRWRNHIWPTAEHAYQAAKTKEWDWMQRIKLAETPGMAKRLGRRAPLRPDWDRLRLVAMESILRAKFAGPEMRSRLLDTGNALLIEGNDWGDTFWGVCDGRGENHLGRLLMSLRRRLADELTPEQVRDGIRNADAFKSGNVFKHAKGHTFAGRAVYIGRIPSLQKLMPCPSGRTWGNPFRLDDESQRPQVIIMYRDWLCDKLAGDPALVRDLALLAGRDLVCHCAPKVCHGDVLSLAALWARDVSS